MILFLNKSLLLTHGLYSFSDLQNQTGPHLHVLSVLIFIMKATTENPALQGCDVMGKGVAPSAVGTEIHLEQLLPWSLSFVDLRCACVNFKMSCVL